MCSLSYSVFGSNHIIRANGGGFTVLGGTFLASFSQGDPTVLFGSLYSGRLNPKPETADPETELTQAPGPPQPPAHVGRMRQGGQWPKPRIQNVSNRGRGRGGGGRGGGGSGVFWGFGFRVFFWLPHSWPNRRQGLMVLGL